MFNKAVLVVRFGQIGVSDEPIGFFVWGSSGL